MRLNTTMSSWSTEDNDKVADAMKFPSLVDPKLNVQIKNKIRSAKVLVIGAGGIGCEILKNLVLSGFVKIDIIDLDTIDVTNLNRQFLFQKEHVGKAKSEIAAAACKALNPSVEISFHVGSIQSPKFNLDYFSGFDIVFGALDNQTARKHINRMCLVANVLLIESGSAGYSGQVQIIKKGVFECYECIPKAAEQKTFPGCTIRNTPSEPIHCIVWAKHLFNQLFGEPDPDEDVSPDTTDPEAGGQAGDMALQGEIQRVSTRAWATEHNYNAEKLFTKFFKHDIEYLLSMTNLWESRRKPVPLVMSDLPDAAPGTSQEPDEQLRDQVQWSIKHCAEVFSQCLLECSKQISEWGKSELAWDKDDDAHMNFVTAVTNLRAYIFGIPLKTRFDVKSMAGNIIPAIATTNAIVAGMCVLKAVKLLQVENDEFGKCASMVFHSSKKDWRGKMLVPQASCRPNANCFVCSVNPEIKLCVNIDSFKICDLESKILKGALSMLMPDVELGNSIIISSEEDETEENMPKSLAQMKIVGGSILKCDDFCRDYQLNVMVADKKEMVEDDFEIIGNVSAAKSKAADESRKSTSIETEEEPKAKKQRVDKSVNSLVCIDEDADMFEESSDDEESETSTESSNIVLVSVLERVKRAAKAARVNRAKLDEDRIKSRSASGIELPRKRKHS